MHARVVTILLLLLSASTWFLTRCYHLTSASATKIAKEISVSIIDLRFYRHHKRSLTLTLYYNMRSTVQQYATCFLTVGTFSHLCHGTLSFFLSFFFPVSYFRRHRAVSLFAFDGWWLLSFYFRIFICFHHHCSLARHRQFYTCRSSTRRYLHWETKSNIWFISSCSTIRVHFVPTSFHFPLTKTIKQCVEYFVSAERGGRRKKAAVMTLYYSRLSFSFWTYKMLRI